MDNSFYTSRIQELFSQLLLKMLERLSDTSTSGTPEPTWIQATAKSDSSSSTSSSDAGNVKFSDLISKAAERYNLDPTLISSVIKAESNFNPKAQSSAGAQGLMQLMPATAAGLGVENSFDPEENIDGGARLLRQLLNRYDGDVSLALAAYNAGPGAVDRYNGIPPYQETQTYVSRILGYMKSSNQWSA